MIYRYRTLTNLYVQLRILSIAKCNSLEMSRFKSTSGNSTCRQNKTADFDVKHMFWKYTNIFHLFI